MASANPSGDDSLTPLTSSDSPPAGKTVDAAQEFLSSRIGETDSAYDKLMKAREEVAEPATPTPAPAAEPHLRIRAIAGSALPENNSIPTTATSARDEDSPAPTGLKSVLNSSGDDDEFRVTTPPRTFPGPLNAPRIELGDDDELTPLSTTAVATPALRLEIDPGPVGDGEAQSLMDTHIDDLLRVASASGGSDLHLSVNLPPMVRRDGRVCPLPFEPCGPRDIQRLVYDILTTDQIEKFERTKELDFSYGVRGLGRYRFNVYRQRGSVGAAMRVIPSVIPSLESLKLPAILRELTRRHSGLILVTGPTGSGKSTTIASMIDIINQERSLHIMTIEDPIEYLHSHKTAMVNQRELGTDTDSFNNALRAVLREDPDVILVGEMRDLETIAAAVTLAETGHLVFATLHTRCAPATIDRIVDVFPSHQQEQIRIQLSTSLESVVSQQLLPRLGGGRIASIEVMVATSALRNLIREGKTYQMYSVIETGAQYGMQTMDRTLADLHRGGQVTYEEALSRAIDRENFQRLLKNT
jgi:twitching motility protein PilT